MKRIIRSCGIGVLAVACLLSACGNAAAAEKTLIGTVAVTMVDDDGNVTAATFAAGSRTCNVTLDDNGTALVDELSGELAEVTGTFTEKNGKKWLTVTGFKRIVSTVGTLTVNSENGALTSATLDTLDDREYALVLDEKGKETATKMADKKLAVRGVVIEKDDAEWFAIRECREAVTLTGSVKATADRTGTVQAATLQVDKVVYGIVLDGIGTMCAEDAHGAKAEATGTIEEKAGRKFLTVYAYEAIYEDEPEDPGDMMDDEGWEEEGGDD